jgi:NAD+--asparagine ADP-ribosyltransferase
MSEVTHMASEKTYRNLSDWEERLLARLLAAEFPGREEIAEQVRNCVVKTIDREGSLAFQVRTKALAPVEKRIPVEAEAKDIDGQTVHALLHVSKGKVAELEIYREDGSPIQRLPVPQDWQVVVLPTAPSGGWLGARPN